MAMSVVKDGHHKDMCHDDIGLCVHNLGTILGSIANSTGRAYITIWNKTKKGKKSFMLVSYNLYSLILVLSIVCNLQLLERGNSQFDPKVKLHWSWECPQ